MSKMNVTIKQKYDNVEFTVTDFRDVSDLIKTIGSRVEDVSVLIKLKEHDDSENEEVETDAETD